MPEYTTLFPLPGKNRAEEVFVAGYSLDQLLAWCRNDRLIDAFARDGQQVIIYRWGTRHVMSPEEALQFCRTLYTGAARQNIRWNIGRKIG